MGLLFTLNWKSNSYDTILVVVDCLTKIVDYQPVKTTIDKAGLAEVIIDVVVRHHGLPESIIINWDSLFTLKFWFSLYYFLHIK